MVSARLMNHPIAPIDREAYLKMIATIRDQIGADFDERWDADRTLTFAEIKAVVSEVAGSSSQKERTAPPPRRSDARTLIRELKITEREIAVLSLIAAGKTDKDIAEELFISVRTVQSRIANLLAKMDVNVRSAAVARAIRSGIIL